MDCSLFGMFDTIFWFIISHFEPYGFKDILVTSWFQSVATSLRM
jgi:hypothetical protein